MKDIWIERKKRNSGLFTDFQRLQDYINKEDWQFTYEIVPKYIVPL